MVHDWGSALGFDWARRHPGAVRGIAYMEALVKPFRWADQNPEFASVFQALRSPAGDKMVLEDNIFVEQILPSLIQGELTEKEFAEHRRPFLERGENRRPTLTWPRQIPFDGAPEDVYEIINAYAQWLPTARFPKLFVNSDPGVITAMGDTRSFCRSFSHQTEITVEGLHYVQEDASDEIGIALAAWLDSVC